ncbi:MAG TPA: branched-chain amino acid ABC transporter permease [Acidimicrobiales bacterium]|nr:branched-chain amino acid ABC transporter permease [Acidimicrobiales bacterium]
MLLANVVVPSIGFGIVTASILALAAVGFTLQFGVTNILNLAFGDVMTASAFVGYYVNQAGGDIAESILAAAVFGAVASWALNRCVFTPFVRRGTKLFGMVIVTLSVGTIVQNVLLGAFGADFFTFQGGLSTQYHVAGMTFSTLQLVIIAIGVVAMALLQLLLSRTKLGKAMRATSANPALARVSGISTDRVVDVAWLLSGAMCGLAGIVLVLNTTTFESTTGSSFLVVVIAAAMLGGVGRPAGAMVASVVIGVAMEVAATFITPTFKEVIAFGVLILVLLLRPQGLFGQASSVREVAA